MLDRSWIVHPDQWDAEHVVADLAAIRRYNPQRFEMEQLTAIVYEDTDRHICVGYKDVTTDDFWVRGYLPSTPVMPATLMCEAAHYYAAKQGVHPPPGVLRSLKDVRCWGGVRPGSRLFVVTELLKIRVALLTCRFQCVVQKRLVCEGILTGSPFRSEVLREQVMYRTGGHSHGVADEGRSYSGGGRGDGVGR